MSMIYTFLSLMARLKHIDKYNNDLSYILLYLSLIRPEPIWPGLHTPNPTANTHSSLREPHRLVGPDVDVRMDPPVSGP